MDFRPRPIEYDAVQNEVLLQEQGTPNTNTKCKKLWKYSLIVIIAFTAGSLFLASAYKFGYVTTLQSLNIRNIVRRFYSEQVVLGRDGSVLLIGDSLINRPSIFHDLFDKMDSISNYSTGFTNCGVNGDTIDRIRRRLPPVLHNIQKVTNVKKRVNSAQENKNSQVMVILFWDTDCSDIDEEELLTDDVKLLRAKYERDVKYVIQALLNVGAYIALAGPGTLGNERKTTMLNEYRAINIAITKRFHMEYIDVREAFLNEAKIGKTTTDDGEHPDGHGTGILARLFSAAIIRWKMN